MSQAQKEELKKACAGGNVKKVQDLLIASPSLLVTPLSENLDLTPLHFASHFGKAEIAQVLLAKGANIEVRDKMDWTPLHCASSHGDVETTKVLLANRANIEAKNKKGWTPLHLASKDGHVEIVKVLLMNKANIDARDKDDWTPLHLASKEGHVETIKVLLANEANIDAKSKHHSTPLLLTSEMGHVEATKVLLDSHIEGRDKDGDTPLILASYCGHVEILKMLMAANAGLDSKNVKGEKVGEVFQNGVDAATQQQIKKLLAEEREKQRDFEQLKNTFYKKEEEMTEALQTSQRRLKEAKQDTLDLTKALLASEEENRRLQEIIRRQGGSSVVEKRFPQTKFYKLFASTEPPTFSFDVFAAVKTFIKIYARQQSISDADVHTFIGALHQETTMLGGVDELIGEVGMIAVRLWTSAQTLKNRELCSIFNQAIRDDNEDMMPAVVLFAKGLNLLCITRRMLPSQMRNPEKTYRGGALPQQHQSFFEVGKQFRTPQFLSTSKNRRVAFNFAHMASERGEEPVLWEFVFHPDFGCKHVNFLQRSNVEGEEEFLFTGYSVFTVLSRDFKSNPRWTDPHKIVLEVAPDNRDFPEDLPLSPWS